MKQTDRAAKMESFPSLTSRHEDPEQDFRVRLTSKRKTTELMVRGCELLRSVLDGQPDIPEDSRRVLVQELLANFEAAVRLNVLVDGQPWDEAPDLEDEEAMDLESHLDDSILDTTWRRRSCPKRILPHVVHALKAQRKVLGLYETSVQPAELHRDPDLESIMSDVSAAAPGVVRQAIQVIKAIDALQQQAAGLCEILDLKPSATSLQIHREVLGAMPPAGGAGRRPLAVAQGYEDDGQGAQFSEEEEE
ncbi:kinetochore-associated protein NSL1 homolog [Poeciliopsis prolifica]|uniref:kinetochore-associated protein NSL1 homolog n=1 Tax=Poeciliopsis prolifica TaxID=188132 RepID=UPI002413F240|nr:kinetochore-associated protein NSL1 homolog [Poeciliopsis prolifica]